MNEYEREEINRVRHLMSEEMDCILEIKNKDERKKD